MEENEATFETEADGTVSIRESGSSVIENFNDTDERGIKRQNITFEWDVSSDSGEAKTSSGSGKVSVEIPDSPSTGNNPTEDGKSLTGEAEDAFSGVGSSSSGGPRVDEDRRGSPVKRTYNNIGELEAEVAEERQNIETIIKGIAEKSEAQQKSLQSKINQAGQKHNQLAQYIFAKLPSIPLPSPLSTAPPVPPVPNDQAASQTPSENPLGRQIERTYFHRKYAEAFAPQASAPLIRKASRIFEQADTLASYGRFTFASRALEVTDGLLGTALNPEFSETDILNDDVPDVPEDKPEGKRLRDTCVYRNYVKQKRPSKEIPDNGNIAPVDLADLGIDITEEIASDDSGNDLDQLIDNTLTALDIAIGLVPFASTAKDVITLGTNTNPVTGERISDLETLDIVLDFVPVVGTAKDIISLVTGTNPITNEKLSDFEWVVTASGLLLPPVLGGTAKNIIKNGIKKTSEALQKVVSKGKKSAKTANKLLEKSRQFEDDLTGTVWDSITENGNARPGTAIPESFSLEISGSKFYVPESGTKHMGDHIASPGMGATKSAVVRSQAILTSFKASVEEAMQTGITRDSKVKFGAWELIFKEPTATHDTFEHSIIHAVFMGKVLSK